MEILDRAFYERDTIKVAKELLGKTVEVEAYCGYGDPASRAYHGEIDRNYLMFGGKRD
ncbi:MAG: DNA-3-methyladenine glycosylase [archaeon]|nr:DNA-3-methyladenine glycosylase [archaeon]MCP8314932.1 DNA-3-methyladenine glycosylase [archaeon]